MRISPINNNNFISVNQKFNKKEKNKNSLKLSNEGSDSVSFKSISNKAKFSIYGAMLGGFVGAFFSMGDLIVAASGAIIYSAAGFICGKAKDSYSN